ncbi:MULTISPECIES: hypothetical protein [unclassified Lacinutrix]
MNRTLSLIIGILAVANVIYSFFSNLEHATIFGMELNIWVYRLIWSFLAVTILYKYFKENKASE